MKKEEMIEKSRYANNDIVKYVNMCYTSSSGLTPEWEVGYKKIRNALKRIVTNLGGTKFECNRGHFSLSGFFTYNDQVWYFSFSDVRDNLENMLIRTAKDYVDYSGGTNQYIKIRNFGRGKLGCKDNFTTDLLKLINK